MKNVVHFPLGSSTTADNDNLYPPDSNSYTKRYYYNIMVIIA